MVIESLITAETSPSREPELVKALDREECMNRDGEEVLSGRTSTSPGGRHATADPAEIKKKTEEEAFPYAVIDLHQFGAEQQPCPGLSASDNITFKVPIRVYLPRNN